MDMDIEAIRKQVEQQVMQYFHLEPTVTDAPYAGMVTGVDVISHLEHSLLNPDTTLETIERECAVARKYSVAAVCVAPYYVPAAREILLGSPVAVGTAIGFPHGCMSQAAKLAELLNADMLIILTAVEKVAINFGKHDQQWLSDLTPELARQYIAEGQFAPGSMLPKVQAALSFAESAPGRVALITLLEKAKDGIEGKTGTRGHL